MPAQWKQVETEEEIASIKVKLPQIAGVRPERYLPILFLVVLALVFVLVLIIPGVRAYGSIVTIDTVPSGAAIYVNDQRFGASPTTGFIPAGTQEVTVSFPGLRSTTRTINVEGRVFGSALFPKRLNVTIALDEGIDDGEIESLLIDFHDWALSGRPGAEFQHPPFARILGRTFWSQRDVARSSLSFSQEQVYEALIAGTGEAQLPDTLGGILRASNPGGVLNLVNIEQIVHIFIQQDTNSPGFSAIVDRWVSGLSRTIDTDPYTRTSWSDQRGNTRSTALLAASIELDERSIPRRDSRSIGGYSFVRVPAGTYIVGYPLRDSDDIGNAITIKDDFFILEHEVTNGEYAAFLRSVPEWAPENREQLIARGVVDDSYLVDWPTDWTDLYGADSQSRWEAESNDPVRYISWYAADAFADWVNATLSNDPFFITQNYSVSLPGADTWEYAAFLNALGNVDINYGSTSPVSAVSGNPGSLGAYHLQGNLWEWTQDWFVVNMPILNSPIGAQRVVIGGSFANERLSDGVRGGQPPHWCTPFLGFRIAAYPDNVDEKIGVSDVRP